MVNANLMKKYQLLKTGIFAGREYDTGSWPLYQAWVARDHEIPFHPELPLLFDSAYVWDGRYPLVK
jgi:hypothetical protein